MKMELVWSPRLAFWLVESSGGSEPILEARFSRKVARTKTSSIRNVGAVLLETSPWLPDNKKVRLARDRQRITSHRLMIWSRIRQWRNQAVEGLSMSVSLRKDAISPFARAPQMGSNFSRRPRASGL